MKRILLVDDEPEILQTLRMLLMAAGYLVETAWSSKEALRMANQQPFDLVITDFNMPEMKGDELALRIKEQKSGTPILMLSGSAEILRATGRTMPGVDVLLGKPLNFSELRSQILRLISQAEASANLQVEALQSGAQSCESALRV